MPIDLFNGIAGGYDRTNTVLSFGMDHSWRQQIVRCLPQKDRLHVLDLATGTGNVAIALAGDERVARVVGVDLSEGMLDLARAKVSRRGLSDKVSLVRGDVLALDVPDNSVDAITVGFGVRNFSDLMKGLKEAYRVLKPGGRIIILEFSMPASWFLKAFYGFYLNCCVPLIGAICTGRLSAYNYLVRTIMAFPSGENFSRILSQAGFKAGVRHPLMFGIVTVYTAER